MLMYCNMSIDVAPLWNSILWYTGGNFDEFNQAIRHGGKLTQEQRSHLKNIDKLFELTPPITTPMIVYRGKRSENLHKEVKSFLSTSIEYEQARDFADDTCCILIITVCINRV